MADTKLASLTEDTNPGTDSLVYTVDDPAGTPADRKVTIANLLNRINTELSDGGGDALVDLETLTDEVIKTETFTSGGTADYGVSVQDTLNDSGAAGGSDTYSAFHCDVTETDVTGWDNVYLLNLGVGGTPLVTVNDSGSLLLPTAVGDATPSLRFGDGDTGIEEYADDQIEFVIAGTPTFYMNNNSFSDWNQVSGGIRSVTVSETVPSICPRMGDNNTGIGWATGDALSIISGGVEIARATESTQDSFAVRTNDAAVPDADVPTSFTTFYLDETGNTLVFKCKYADGTTIKTGTVALT